MQSSGSAVPLYTSIPPRLMRLDGDGRDIGAAYGQACAASWSAAGFRPHSINSKHETSPDPSLYPGVQFLSCDRDAKAVVGKPLVFLSDMIRMICDRESGAVVLTNADIEIRPSDAFMAKLAEVRPGHFIVECRFDIESMGADDGKIYTGGYDFFGVHADDLRRLAVNPFVIGMPWWDFYVPFVLIGLGLKPIETPVAPIYHLAHTERWDASAFWKFGGMFTKSVLAHPGLDDKAKAVLRKPRPRKTRDLFRKATWSLHDAVFGTPWDYYPPEVACTRVNRHIGRAVPKLRELLRTY